MNQSQTVNRQADNRHPATLINGHAQPLPKVISVNGSKYLTLETNNGIDTTAWPRDLIEAYARPRGPYTLENAAELLDQYSVELYNGWLVQQELTNPRERRMVANINDMLSLSARQVGFGQSLPDQLECLLSDESVIKPDGSLISWQRLDSKVIAYGAHEHSILVGCPELVIESHSPSNWCAQERRKCELYFANDAQIVWDVDEINNEIWVYYAHAPDMPLHFGLDDEIHCEPLIPGWRRRVADIFADHASAKAIAGEVAEAWRSEGIEIGRNQGFDEGMAQTLRSLLPVLARAHYGSALPETIADQLQRCTLAQLQQLQSAIEADIPLAEWLRLIPD
ncbi:MAG: Uma2 family endonuclease [Caldilineaceae bacterium]